VGSVGIVETRFVDLPQPLALDSWRELHSVRIAYETYGTLSPSRDNVILESHEMASKETYPGLPTSQYRPLVDKYLPGGTGAVFSFDCRGGRQAGQDFILGVSLWSHLANIGDSKSLIIHPSSTTHRQLTDDELQAAGVGPGTIRLSVGIEKVDDLIWDLEQGFAAVAASTGSEVASS